MRGLGWGAAGARGCRVGNGPAESSLPQGTELRAPGEAGGGGRARLRSLAARLSVHHPPPGSLGWHQGYEVDVTVPPPGAHGKRGPPQGGPQSSEGMGQVRPGEVGRVRVVLGGSGGAASPVPEGAEREAPSISLLSRSPHQTRTLPLRIGLPWVLGLLLGDPWRQLHCGVPGGGDPGAWLAQGSEAASPGLCAIPALA